jgi:hypothetical protein
LTAESIVPHVFKTPKEWEVEVKYLIPAGILSAEPATYAGFLCLLITLAPVSGFYKKLKISTNKGFLKI